MLPDKPSIPGRKQKWAGTVNSGDPDDPWKPDEYAEEKRKLPHEREGEPGATGRKEN